MNMSAISKYRTFSKETVYVESNYSSSTSSTVACLMRCVAVPDCAVVSEPVGFGADSTGAGATGVGVGEVGMESGVGAPFLPFLPSMDLAAFEAFFSFLATFLFLMSSAVWGGC